MVAAYTSAKILLQQLQGEIMKRSTILPQVYAAIEACVPQRAHIKYTENMRKLRKYKYINRAPAILREELADTRAAIGFVTVRVGKATFRLLNHPDNLNRFLKRILARNHGFEGGASCAR